MRKLMQEEAFWRFVAEQRKKAGRKSWEGRRTLNGAQKAWSALMPLVRRLAADNQALREQVLQLQVDLHEASTETGQEMRDKVSTPE